jgi:hypothetical protein
MKVKKRLILVSAFLSLSAAVATAQSLLPQPQIIDHQIVTGTDVTSLTATEDIKSAYNILEVVVTCNNAGNNGYPCLASVKDGSGTDLTSVSYWSNDTQDWSEQIFYIVEPTTGTQTITANTEFVCSCTFNMLVQQVQGIAAHQ